MSDNIPFELQSEFMKRLPVKSLLQFRSVCKSWKSLIDSSDFIHHHISQQQHLLVRYIDAATSEQKYVSVVDDDDDTDTFPQHKVSVTVPRCANMSNHYTIVDSSHGLFCLFGDRQQKAVIWNPCIRKSVAVTVPVIAGDDHDNDEDVYITFLGFGVCRKTKDPKIVKITIDIESVNPRKVEVFTLSAMAWRGPYSSNNLPRKSLYELWSQVVVDGCLYWLASDTWYTWIVSFDLTSEEFTEVNLPDGLADPQCNLSMYKLTESLVVIKNGREDDGLVHVWMMEVGASKSFIKLYTISHPSLDVSRVCGFRNTGEALVDIQAHLTDTRILAAFEPDSKSISLVGINGKYFSVYPYIETLLLL